MDKLMHSGEVSLGPLMLMKNQILAMRRRMTSLNTLWGAKWPSEQTRRRCLGSFGTTKKCGYHIIYSPLKRWQVGFAIVSRLCGQLAVAYSLFGHVGCSSSLTILQTTRRVMVYSICGLGSCPLHFNAIADRKATIFIQIKRSAAWKRQRVNSVERDLVTMRAVLIAGRRQLCTKQLFEIHM